MAWFILKQPNKMFARWSDVLDNFERVQMNRQEAISCCVDHGDTVTEAREKVDRVHRRNYDPNVWNECISKIWKVHGRSEARRAEAEGKKEPRVARKHDEYTVW